MTTLHMMRTSTFIAYNQHNIVGYFRSKLEKMPTNNGAQSHMATSMIPPSLLAKPSPCILRSNPLCALWTYLRDFVNRMAISPQPVVYRMARIGIDKPPYIHLEPTSDPGDFWA